MPVLISAFGCKMMDSLSATLRIEFVAQLPSVRPKTIPQIALRLTRSAERLVMLDGERLQSILGALFANLPRFDDHALKLPPVLP